MVLGAAIGFTALFLAAGLVIHTVTTCQRERDAESDVDDTIYGYTSYVHCFDINLSTLNI